MAVFPLFVDLKGKRCLVVGGGEVASRKAEILLRFEAQLTIVAPEINHYISGLEEQGKTTIIRREYCEQDMSMASLVIAATSSKTVNERVYRDAVGRNIPVNIVDDPELCTFIFPSVVKRGALTVGISTSGEYPALSKKIRKITEEIFHEGYSEILELLADYRSLVRTSRLSKFEKEKELGLVLEEFYSGGEITPQALSKILEEHKLKYLI
ncbi:MAG: siroheme synthase [Eubacterium sp.]|nr:siroheme synthase [Eubacterium sp.]